MVTFTRLLVISTVVRSCSLSVSNVLIRLSVSVSLDSILFKSDGDSEKKAISDAEANADTNSRSAANTIAKIAGVVGGVTVIELKMVAPKRPK